MRGAYRGAPAAEAAVALARVGSPQAVDVLLEVANDEREQDLHRAFAVAGLGRIADPALVPTLALLTEHQNYRASTDLVNELFSLF